MHTATALQDQNLETKGEVLAHQAGEAQEAEDQAEPSRLDRMVHAAAVTGTAVLAAVGVAAYKPDTAQALGSVGPALSANKGTANRQFDWMLRKTGPDGVMAQQVARGFNLKSSAARHKYLTPGNIDLGKRVTATNRKYPLNTGSDGSHAITVPNNHYKSSAYTVTANEISSKSESSTHLNAKEKFELSYDVLRKLCENMLGARRPHHTPRPQSHTQPNSKINIDFSYGIKNDLSAKAKSISQSGSSVSVVCPDGTRVNSSSSAYAIALANASAHMKAKGEAVIKAKGISFVQLQAKYNQKYQAAVSAATSTKTASSIYVECAKPPVTPPPITPPDHTINGNPNPSRHRYTEDLSATGSMECVDDISDTLGHHVDAEDFRFTDENGQEVGGITSNVYQPNPNDPTVQCVNWNSGTEPKAAVRMSANLTDHLGKIVNKSSSYTFPVLERPN